MTAGVRAIPATPRCGCCDGYQAFAICERCQEPTCVKHFARITSFEGGVSYVCVVCAEAIEKERAEASTEAVTA